MPANLPPAYKEAEARYRTAKSPAEKLIVLEEMLSLLPKHKGTDKLRAQLRRRTSALEKDIERQGAPGRKGKGLPFKIQREGAGQVHLVGLPNSGKSRLLDSLTKAEPAVAEYPFTTHLPLPGMMRYENVQMQLIDLPPLMDDAATAWLPNLLRSADALLLVLATDEDLEAQLDIILESLGQWRIEAVGTGEPEAREDAVLPKRCLLVGTKLDLEEGRPMWERFVSGRGGAFPHLATSAASGEGLDALPEAVFRLLRIVRVYTKAPGKEAALGDPLTLREGATVEDAARATHKDFARGLAFTRLWGGGKFKGQRVGRDHPLRDGDLLEFHL